MTRKRTLTSRAAEAAARTAGHASQTSQNPRALTDARLQVQLDVSIQETYEEVRAERPPNTSKTWDSKAEEYIQWCLTKGFPDQERVTGPKLHLFLKEEVVYRKKRKPGRPPNRKRRRVQIDEQNDEFKSENDMDIDSNNEMDVDTENNNTQNESVFGELDYSTVSAYACSVVDLWKTQRQLGMNNSDHPRDESVKTLLGLVHKEKTKRKKAQFVDRGKNGLLDGYTTNDEIELISLFFWNKKGCCGAALRDRMLFLLSHACLLRGDDARRAELADMFSVKMDFTDTSYISVGQGEGRPMALVILINNGKTNQTGRMEYGGALRHKNYLICPVSSCAFYFFWRFHVHDESFPNLEVSRDWFDIKMASNHRERKTVLSFQTHYKSFKNAFSELKLNFAKKTHVNRGSGARMAELNGVSDASIRRAGRWNGDALQESYLTHLPWETILCLSGFRRTESYHLQRARLLPDIHLQNKIFPQLEEFREINTLSGTGFADLLRWFRVVILQDACQYILEGKTNSLFDHEIFKSPEFLDYMNEVKSSVSEEIPDNVILRRCVPEVVDRLINLERRVSEESSRLETSIDRRIEDVMQNVNTLGRETVAQLDALQRNFTSSPPELTFTVSVRGNNVKASQSTVPVDVSTSDLNLQTSSSNDLRTLSGWKTFRMSRGIETIPELWIEWTEKVVLANQEVQTAWRSSPSERQWYSRRKVIISHIEQLQKSMSVEDSVRAAETERIELGKSIDGYSKYLAHRLKPGPNSVVMASAVQDITPVLARVIE
jgi:hypothetical protein